MPQSHSSVIRRLVQRLVPPTRMSDDDRALVQAQVHAVMQQVHPGQQYTIEEVLTHTSPEWTRWLVWLIRAGEPESTSIPLLITRFTRRVTFPYGQYDAGAVTASPHVVGDRADWIGEGFRPIAMNQEGTRHAHPDIRAR